jgi:glutamate 5-kinase
VVLTPPISPRHWPASGGTVFHGTQRPTARVLARARDRTRGRLHLDDGADRAVVDRRASLLPAGITAVDSSSRVTRWTSSTPAVRSPAVWSTTTREPGLLSRSTVELAAEQTGEREVIHRDDLVLLSRRGHLDDH